MYPGVSSATTLEDRSERLMGGGNTVAASRDFFDQDLLRDKETQRELQVSKLKKKKIIESAVSRGQPLKLPPMRFTMCKKGFKDS